MPMAFSLFCYDISIIAAETPAIAQCSTPLVQEQKFFCTTSNKLFKGKQNTIRRNRFTRQTIVGGRTYASNYNQYLQQRLLVVT